MTWRVRSKFRFKHDALSLSVFLKCVLGIVNLKRSYFKIIRTKIIVQINENITKIWTQQTNVWFTSFPSFWVTLAVKETKYPLSLWKCNTCVSLQFVFMLLFASLAQLQISFSRSIMENKMPISSKSTRNK